MDVETYKATVEITEQLRTHKPKDLPFEKLKPGYSFFVDFALISEGSLRTMVSSKSASLNRLFRCFKNKNVGAYEITEVDPAYENKLEFKIVECSPEAKSLLITNLEGKRCYPFDELPEGKSFIVPIAQANEKSLRVACSKHSKQGNRMFLISHKEYGMYEIYHAPKSQIQEFKFFEPTQKAMERGTN